MVEMIVNNISVLRSSLFRHSYCRLYCTKCRRIRAINKFLKKYKILPTPDSSRVNSLVNFLNTLPVAVLMILKDLLLCTA